MHDAGKWALRVLNACHVSFVDVGVCVSENKVGVASDERKLFLLICWNELLYHRSVGHALEVLHRTGMDSTRSAHVISSLRVSDLMHDQATVRSVDPTKE